MLQLLPYMWTNEICICYVTHRIVCQWNGLYNRSSIIDEPSVDKDGTCLFGTVKYNKYRWSEEASIDSRALLM